MDANRDNNVILSQEEKRQLLANLLYKKKRETLTFPLSFSQQRLWFLDQLSFGNLSYNMLFALHLPSPLNFRVLERSLNEIVQRHEILRTNFELIDGVPVQKISASLKLNLLSIDLQYLSGSDGQHQVLQALAQQRAQQQFDLQDSALFTTDIIYLNQKEHILFLSIHHIIFDGWSYRIFMHELETLYTAFVSGQTLLLPPLSIQYADFAAWQQKWMQSAAFERQLSYWRKQLENLPTLNLPVNYARTSGQSDAGSECSIMLPSKLVDGLKVLCQQEKTTLFMLLLTAFQILLQRYTNQDDIPVGIDVLGRSRKEFEGLIGFFINVLVFRIDLSNNPTFLDTLRRVRECSIESFENQDLPFDKIVEELQPKRDLGLNPLFQTTFSYQDFRSNNEMAQGIKYYPLGLRTSTAKFDLSIHLIEENNGLHGIMSYKTDLFNVATIMQMLNHYQNLLESIVAHPQKPITELSILSSKERSLLLQQNNDTHTPLVFDHCLHILFEQQALRTPDALAVLYKDSSLTYKNLHECTNQLAHYLQRLGVQPEVPVGVFMERSLSTLIAMLAILKAGGFYVPLDPSYPAAHRAMILNDLHPQVILTNEELALDLPVVSAHVVRLDIDADVIGLQPVTMPDTSVVASNLCFVMYTSGSTGQPKGVAVEHKQLLNRFAWMWHAYPFQPGEVTAQRTIVNSTVSMWEFLGPLLSGTPIRIFPDDVTNDLPLFIREIHLYSISRIVLVPSLLRLILNSAEDLEHQLGQLRLWSVGGEALSADIVQKFYQRLPKAHLLNQYGSSELNDAACYHVDPDKEGSHALLGHPIDNLRIYLLDGNLEPVPTGTQGELYVASIAPARGYIHQPALTAERFIPDPFGKEPGSFLYRTGDVGRRHLDGQIEYIGRRDYQIKIRGLRVDLQGIEATLRSHQDVIQTLVITSVNSSQESQIVAYIVAREEAKLTSESLRRFLLTLLPTYMVPAIIVIMNAFPMTPNGKVDRKALPDPSRTNLIEEMVAPRTQTEHRLYAIWLEVLEIEQMSVFKNFFDLGGHSLQAVQLAYKISAVVGIELTVNSIMKYPTIASLSKEIIRLKSSADDHQQKQAQLAYDAQASVYPNTSDSVQTYSSHTQIERRSLLTLISANKIEGVQSAVIGCLHPDLYKHSGLAMNEIIVDVYDNVSTIHDVVETQWGRVALITIPRFVTQLQENKETLLSQLVSALRLAKSIGAKTVSLEDSLLIATNDGRDLVVASKDLNLPAITTSYGTKTAARFLAIKRMFNDAERDLSREQLGFLGLSACSETVLHTVLKFFPHPSDIYLWDAQSSLESLERIRGEIYTNGFVGTVHVIGIGEEVSSHFYQASFIVVDSHVSDLLNIEQLQPGTLIIDSSTTHVLNLDLVRERVAKKHDLMFTEGDILKMSQPYKKLSYIPSSIEAYSVNMRTEQDPTLVESCLVASLLPGYIVHPTPIVDNVDVETTMLHCDALEQLSLQAPPLRYNGYTIPDSDIKAFLAQYGSMDFTVSSKE